MASIVSLSNAGAQTLDPALASVGGVLSAFERTCPILRPRAMEPAHARGGVLCEDVRAGKPVPPCDIALGDGRALASADLIGASPMSPAFVVAEPAHVQAGDALPAGCDCVIDRALVFDLGAGAEIHGSAAPGEGVRRAGEDVARGDMILAAGARVSPFAVLALQKAGIQEVVARSLRIRLVATPHTSGKAHTAHLIGELAKEESARVEIVEAGGRDADNVARAMVEGDADVVFVIGGAGVGDDDHSVEALRTCGDVIAHGLALDPGRTGAAGLMGGKPVICFPGRFDAALSVYLALGRPLLRRLLGAGEPGYAREAPLSRKIASTVGLAQLVLLAASDGKWTPLCVGDVTLSLLLRADAYLVIGEGSEGVAEGCAVQPLRLPGRGVSE